MAEDGRDESLATDDESDHTAADGSSSLTHTVNRGPPGVSLAVVPEVDVVSPAPLGQS